MLTYSKIGRKGNLGNQFFQIAGTIGLALEHKHEYGFLTWQYQKYFKNKLPFIGELPVNIEIMKEGPFHYHSWDFKSDIEHYDLEGWLQSEKYFDRERTKYYFEFNDDLVATIKAKYDLAFQKKTILISIRRGDFVDHPDYLQLSIRYYLNALIRFFPDWESRSIVVLSDDIAYCKFHFSFLPNVFFGDGLNAIEQLCLGSLCDDFIISNSTFSWWSAWLGEKEQTKIIRPHKNFDGAKSLESDDKDYFPERWISYDVNIEKLEMKQALVCFNFTNNQEKLRAYLKHYFEVEVKNDTTKREDVAVNFHFQEDLVLSPVLLYYSYLKKIATQHQMVVIQIDKVVKVSTLLNYKEFANQQDFGLFSKIFSFNKSDSKKAIYLTNNRLFEEKEVELCFPNAIVINSIAGQFCNTGFLFSFKRLLKNLEIFAKRNLKKVLFPKRK